ncbi:MAG: hypothetical protein HY840_04860 [Bacteroidetes bacterium]|nr:hypothetical protein [Bacteroidota bacterium]
MNSKNIPIFISIIVLLQLVVLFIIQPEINLWEDHNMAVSLLQTGDAFCYNDGQPNHSFVFPVYYGVVFFVYKIFGIVPIYVAALHLIFNGATAFFAYKAAVFFIETNSLIDKIFFARDKIASVLACSVLFHPFIFWYSFANVHPFAFDMFFFYACLFFTTVYFRNKTMLNLLIFAVVYGLAVLDRPTLMVCVIPFLLLSFKYMETNKIILNFSVISILSIMIIAPYLIRNYHTDKIFGFNSNTGKILWKGVLYNSEGSNYLKNGKNYYAALGSKDFGLLINLSVKDQNKFFMNKYIEIWKEDPFQVIKMYLVKLKNFWWFRENIGNEYSQAIQTFIPLYKIMYGGMLLFAVFFCMFSSKGIFFLVSAPIALSLFQSFFYVETRHRIIIEPILIFLAILGLFLLRHKLSILKNNYN